jgi:SnoaL-like domain
MAERSREVEEFLFKMEEAFTRRDLGFLERTTSHEVGTLDIATDPDEWAEGYEAIIQAERDMMKEGPQQWDVYLEEVAAFREGSVGWGAGRGYAEIAGKRVRLRMTAVVHLEDGEWKRLQSHTSIGVPNGDVLNPIFQPQARAT